MFSTSFTFIQWTDEVEHLLPVSKVVFRWSEANCHFKPAYYQYHANFEVLSGYKLYSAVNTISLKTYLTEKGTRLGVYYLVSQSQM